MYTVEYDMLSEEQTKKYLERIGLSYPLPLFLKLWTH